MLVYLTRDAEAPDAPLVFDDRTVCILGRDKVCDPRIPDDKAHRSISRLHCMLDINPPDIRVRDFGSKYGTFVNGKKIGQRRSEEERGQAIFPEHDLQDGDELRLGDPAFGAAVVFRVRIEAPVLCAGCGVEIEGRRRPSAASGGKPGKVAAGEPESEFCSACRAKAAATASYVLPPARCVQCGRDVAKEMSAGRVGDYVCRACQAAPAEAARRLLGLGKRQPNQPTVIEGYDIISELGRGGMGAVFLARHKSTGRELALKVMLPRVAVERRTRDMFVREVENTLALRHPNIVAFHEMGCSQGTFFFTMEYCARGSVGQLLKVRRRPLDVEEAVGIILQALDGLEFAHNADLPRVRLSDGSYGAGRGVVHRDLKPDNLFVAADGVVKIGDFGLAKAFDLAGLSGQSRTGAYAGTAVFMPRQQVIQYKYAKPDVDVWAMAASLYFMLTGAYPRDFPKGKDPFLHVLQSSAVPIRGRRRELPKALAETIDAALIDEPQITYATATELKAAIAAAIGRRSGPA